MFRRKSRDLATEDCSDVDDTVVAWLRELAAGPALAIRRIGDTGISSRQGPPADIPDLIGDASEAESGILDDEVNGIFDASLLMQIRALCGPRPDIQVRQIDPTLRSKMAQSLLQAPAGASGSLAPRPEIEPCRGHLGAGSFGKALRHATKDGHLEVVVKVPHQGSGVMKKGEKEMLGELKRDMKLLGELKREVEMVSELKHVGPFQFHCLLRGPPDALVPELCAGSATANLLHGEKSINDDLAARASLDMATAVEYSFMRHTGHRDIKGGISLLPVLVRMPVANLPQFKFGYLGWARELAGHTAQCTGKWGYVSSSVTCSNQSADPADICSCSLLFYEGVSEMFPKKFILDNFSMYMVLYFAQIAATNTLQYGPRVID